MQLAYCGSAGIFVRADTRTCVASVESEGAA
jgi:hypothetical protein